MIFTYISILLLFNVPNIEGSNSSSNNSSNSTSENINNETTDNFIVCGNSPFQLNFYKTEQELLEIQNCNIYNGSIFINGEYDINDLEPLHNLEIITGYLLIWNTPAIRTLRGLRNLKQILGEILYLDRYSVYISDNVNEFNGEGLCYANHINWGEITEELVYTNDNAEECLHCHPECIGCWAYGPVYCQSCRNFLSGETCINQCPEGTTIDYELDSTNRTCLETIPNNPILNLSTLSFSDIEVRWNQPEQPNGVITGFRLYQDGIIVLEEHMEYNGITNPSILNTHYLASNLVPSTQYEFSIQVKNSVGWSHISQIYSQMTQDGIPNAPTNLTLSNINDTRVQINWTNPNNIQGVITLFYYQIWEKNQLLVEGTLPSNYQYHNFIGLNAYTEYKFRLKLQNRNHNSSYTSFVYFVTDVGIPPVPESPEVIMDERETNNLIVIIYPSSNISGPLMKYSLNVFQYNSEGWLEINNGDNNVSNNATNTINNTNINIHTYYELNLGNISLTNSQYELNEIILLSLDNYFNLTENTPYKFSLTAYTSPTLYSESVISEAYYTLNTQDQDTSDDSNDSSDSNNSNDDDQNNEHSTSNSNNKDWKFYTILGGIGLGTLVILFGCYYCISKIIDNNNRNRRVNNRNTNTNHNSIYNNNISSIRENIINNPLYQLPENQETTITHLGSLERNEERNKERNIEKKEKRRRLSSDSLRQRRPNKNRRPNDNILMNELNEIVKRRSQISDIEVINEETGSIRSTESYQRAKKLNKIPKNMIDTRNKHTREQLKENMSNNDIDDIDDIVPVVESDL